MVAVLVEERVSGWDQTVESHEHEPVGSEDAVPNLAANGAAPDVLRLKPGADQVHDERDIEDGDGFGHLLLKIRSALSVQTSVPGHSVRQRQCNPSSPDAGFNSSDHGHKGFFLRVP
ncbi:MAG: hypothetical protein J3Q66DRAFT_383992 [Benniella sp.]|nr:MAG: hypothetical protein J3Q66DRAFT_383992 [Benniella sp.]